MSKPFGRKEERVLIRLRPLRNKFTRRARSKRCTTPRKISASYLRLRDRERLMPFPPSSQIEKSRTDVKLELLARNRGKKEGTEKEEEEEEEVEEEEEEKGRERRASQLAHTSLAGGRG